MVFGKRGWWLCCLAAMIVGSAMVAAQGFQTLSCTIAEPNVTQPSTPYPSCRFQQGDRVVVSASGCVQTGGHGLTWKSYVNPQGPDSDHLYHGLIQIPGATTGLVRLNTVVGRQLIVGSVSAGGDFLVLGYEDTQYSDNGYTAHDDGTGGQCKGVGAAQVTIAIERPMHLPSPAVPHPVHLGAATAPIQTDDGHKHILAPQPPPAVVAEAAPVIVVKPPPEPPVLALATLPAAAQSEPVPGAQTAPGPVQPQQLQPAQAGHQQPAAGPSPENTLTGLQSWLKHLPTGAATYYVDKKMTLNQTYTATALIHPPGQAVPAAPVDVAPQAAQQTLGVSAYMRVDLTQMGDTFKIDPEQGECLAISPDSDTRWDFRVTPVHGSVGAPQMITFHPYAIYGADAKACATDNPNRIDMPEAPQNVVIVEDTPRNLFQQFLDWIAANPWSALAYLLPGGAVFVAVKKLIDRFRKPKAAKDPGRAAP